MGIVNRLATERYVSNEITVVQSGTDTKVEEHNTATDSHSDIRTLVNGKAEATHSHTPAQIGLTTETWTFTLEDGSTVTKAVYVG